VSYRSTDGQEALAPSDVLGSVHVGGLYNFTDDDYLNEGGGKLEEFGTGVARIWDSNNQPQTSYRFNMDWPEAFGSLVETYRDGHIQEFFNRSFNTIVITSYARSTPGIQDHYWREGVSDEQYHATVEEFEEATRYLLEAYDGAGKTFVLQNWEGDWAILDDVDQDPPEPTQRNVDGMIRWLSARQEGFERARSAVDSDASVLHAVSVNQVRSAMAGDRRVVNAIVPEIDPELDMVAYSSWDVLVDAAETDDDEAAAAMIEESLSYIHEHAPEPSPYVESVLTPDTRNVFVGEFGWDLVADPELGMRLIRLMTETAMDWGARWLLFWQLFSNEPSREYDGRPTNDGVKGFYLVKPDGRKSDAWHYFRELLERNREF